MNLPEFLRESFIDYIRYLDEGGSRQVMPLPVKRKNLEGYIHASNMMDCPLKAAIEQIFDHTDVRYPQLHKHNNPSMLFRMQEGNRIAEIVQEAIAWNANRRFYTNVHELELISDKMKMIGRVDSYVDIDDETQECLIEFKHRVKSGNWKPAPRIGDVFQLLAYREMFIESVPHHSPPQCYLVLLDTPSWGEFFDEKAALKIYHLIEDLHGFVLVDEEGYLWHNKDNNPDYINTATLYSEMERQHLYLEAMAHGNAIAPPIELHEADAWQCRSIDKKATEKVEGTFHAVCHSYCHDTGFEDTTFRGYTVKEDGTWSLPW